MNADIIILTPILIEYEAVKSLLKTAVLLTHPTAGYTYLHAKVKAKKARYDIVVRKTGSGNVTISNEVHQLVRDFKPKVILLTGTAGGIKKVKIGDLIIGNKAYSYETGREKEDSFSSRPEALLASTDLIELADKIAQEAHWKKNLPDSKKINYYIKPIISGEKVIESVDNYLVKRIRQHYDDAIALEMEAAGFLQAMRAYPTIKVLNIRSVSDLLGNKSAANKEGSRERAAQIAAAFTMELIYNLPIKKRRAAPVFLGSTAVVLVVIYLFFSFLKQPVTHLGEKEKEEEDTQDKEGKDSLTDSSSFLADTTTIIQKEDVLKNDELANETKPIIIPVFDIEKENTREEAEDKDTTVDSTIVVLPLEELEKNTPVHEIKYHIHVFDTSRELVSGVQFELDGRFLGDDVGFLDLISGATYNLKLKYGNMEYTRKIKGPELNNQELSISLNFFTPIITH